MARAKTAAQKAASRANIKKAQAASARARRGKGKGKLASANRQASKFRRRQRIVNGVAVAAVGAYTGAVAYQHYKRYKHNQRVRSTDHARTSRPSVSHANAGPQRVRSVNQLRSAARSMGLPMSRRDAARAMQESAAHGTSGHHSRRFTARSAAAAQPGGAAPHPGHTKAPTPPVDRNARRMRIHHKVGLLGHYQAGLSHGHGSRTIIAGTRGAIGRR